MIKKIARISRWHRGFSLIEILVVITIIAILTSIGYVSFSNAQQKGRDARRKKDLEAVKAALVEYYMDKGAYPPGSADTNTLFRSDNTTEWIPGISAYLSSKIGDPRQSGTYTPSPPSNGAFDVESNNTDGYLSYNGLWWPPPDYIGNCSSDIASPSMSVGFFISGVNATHLRGYLTFDTAAGIPDGATITAATLRFYTAPTTFNPTYRDLSLQIRNFDWGNSLACPPINSTSGYDWGGIDQQGTLPDATIVGGGPVSNGSGIRWINLADFSAINKTGTTSFMLTSQAEASNDTSINSQRIYIDTRNSATSGNWPRLFVNYTTPVNTNCFKLYIYCYDVSADRSSFVLWAYLENTNDQSRSSIPTAACTNTNNQSGYFNYCVESPK